MPEHKRIFLTGATGFLGSHLAGRFLSDGHAVSVLARGSKTASARERVETVLQDLGEIPLDHLAVFEGDISQPGLGFSEAALNRLVSIATRSLR
jgi:thioester reductase-like protein